MKGLGEREEEKEREGEIHTLASTRHKTLPTPSQQGQSGASKLPCSFCFVFLNARSPEPPSPVPSPQHKNMKGFFCPFSNSKLSIRFHHILVKQLHQENDSACGINYACSWPETKGCEVGEGRIVRHTQIKSPCISQMDPISSSYCLKSSCT